MNLKSENLRDENHSNVSKMLSAAAHPSYKHSGSVNVKRLKSNLLFGNHEADKLKLPKGT